VSVAGLLLGDSRFPAGGHAHSGGIEPAVTAGTVTDLASLEVFLRGRLRTAGLVAAGIAAAACAHARGAAGASPGESAAPVLGHGFWAELDAEADARMPAPAQREASRRQGRALLRAARVAWPDAAGLASLTESFRARGARAANEASEAGQAGWVDGARDASEARRADGVGGDRRPDETGVAARADETGVAARVEGASGDSEARREYRGGPHHAVVLGAAAAAAGCSPLEAARIAAYQAIAGPVSAAVRLLALDPMRATGVLARLAGEIDQIAGRGSAYSSGPLSDLPCPSAPALDLLAETHIRAEVRLFES
jgi:urease accessory protein